jgi:hypothetical protein
MTAELRLQPAKLAADFASSPRQRATFGYAHSGRPMPGTKELRTKPAVATSPAGRQGSRGSDQGQGSMQAHAHLLRSGSRGLIRFCVQTSRN